MKLQTLLIIVVCAATTGLLPIRLAAAEPPADPRLEKVFADWQKRRERIKTIRYRTSGEVTLPKGSFTDDITGAPLGPDAPPHDITWPKSIVFLLDFTTNRHRLEEDEQGHEQSHGRLVPPRTTTTVFDSKELWSLHLRPAGAKPDKNNPDIDIASGNLRGEAFPSEYWPFFLGHGIINLLLQQHILPGRLSSAPQKDIFDVEGVGNFADRACLVLRTQAQQIGSVGWDELWVDPGRESAVLRQASYANGKVVTDIQIEYQNTQAGWLPQSWTITNGTGDRVFSLERMHVDELEIDPAVSDADFRLDVKPGMIVRRTSFPGSPDQMFSPNPDPDHPLMRVNPDGSLSVFNGPEPRSLWPLYLAVGVAILLLAGIGSTVWWRRSKVKPAA